MGGDIPIWWNSTYDITLWALRLCIPLRNWLDEKILEDVGLEHQSLLNVDWKKLKYFLILLRLFAEYTALIGNTRDATINHTWNVYNTLFDHMDMIWHKFNCKNVEKTPWMSEFIVAVDAGTEKLKEYYSKTGRPVESQYALAAMLDPSQKLGIFELPEWGVTHGSGSIQRSLQNTGVLTIGTWL